VFRKELGGSSPPLVALLSHKSTKELQDVVNNNINNFENDGNNDRKEFANFLFLKKNLSESTIDGYISHLKVLERTVKKSAYSITKHDVEKFLLKIKQSNSPKTFNNYLCMLKSYYT
jgi:hypothetical protein